MVPFVFVKYFLAAMDWSLPRDELIIFQSSSMSSSLLLSSIGDTIFKVHKAQNSTSEGPSSMGAWLAPDENIAADLKSHS